MPRPKCEATTKKGTRCSRYALDGLTVCIAHADGQTKASKGFGGIQPGGGRPPAPRAVDVLKERIEQDIDLVLDPLWEALDADNGVVVGNGAHAVVEMVPDHRTRIAAARELLDRGYGKAKQVSEISTPDGNPLLLVTPVDQRDRSARAAELLAERGLVHG